MSISRWKLARIARRNPANLEQFVVTLAHNEHFQEYRAVVTREIEQQLFSGALDGVISESLPIRERLAKHREMAACASCHNLMDPIGFGLETFDWMGRLKEGPVDSKGTLPSGETFDGPVELRNILLSRKEEFLRHISGKVLGYALGRGISDSDQCTIQRIVDKLNQNNASARLLIHEIVLSSPFRNHQTGTAVSMSSTTTSKPVRTRLLGDK